MRYRCYFHGVLLFWMVALSCSSSLGSLRDEIEAILEIYGIPAKSYSISSPDQTLEVFCQQFEEEYWRGGVSVQLQEVWEKKYQSRQCPQNSSTAPVETSMEISATDKNTLIYGQGPLSEIVLLKLAWYAAVIQKTIVVLDMLAEPGHVTTLTGFYLTAGGDIQYMSDELVDQQDWLINEAIVFMRTGDLWSYVSGDFLHSVLQFLKANLPLTYPSIHGAPPFNINLKVDSTHGMGMYKGGSEFMNKVERMSAGATSSKVPTESKLADKLYYFLQGLRIEEPCELTEESISQQSPPSQYVKPGYTEVVRTFSQGLAARKAMLDNEGHKQINKVHQRVLGDKERAFAYIKGRNPQLVQLVTQISNMLSDPYKRFDQAKFMSLVREMFTLYYETMIKDKTLSHVAAALSMMEDWFNRFVQHPVIALHRSNFNLWSDVIGTLSLLNQIRCEYPVLKGIVNDEEIKRFEDVDFSSFLKGLTKLLEGSSDLNNAYLLETLKPFHGIIQDFLTVLRESALYIPPQYYPPIFEDVYKLLDRHKERILSAEMEFYPSWYAANKFIKTMIENSLESHLSTIATSEKLCQSYAKEVEDAYIRLSNLPVEEQIGIAEEFTGTGFFSGMVKQLVLTENMKSISGYQLSATGAITGPHKPVVLQALPLAGEAVSASEQWKLVSAEYDSAVARRHFTPDVSQASFSVTGDEGKKSVALQLGPKKYNFQLSQQMMSCINLHEDSIVRFLRSSPGYRMSRMEYTVKHMKGQLEKSQKGEGYLSHLVNGMSRAKAYLLSENKVRTSLPALKASNDYQALPWVEEPWKPLMRRDQLAILPGMPTKPAAKQ